MNRKRTDILERRHRLLNMIQEIGGGQLDIERAAQLLGVSPVTLRRDLCLLEEEGRVRRAYGRVSLTESPEREEQTLDIPNRIAHRAAGLVEPGDVIYLNTDRIALRLLRYIEAPHVTVVTNNTLAANVPHRDDLNLILTGGEVRDPKYAMTGTLTRQVLSSVHANKAFLGCGGLSAARGMTADCLAQAAIDWLMLTQVSETAYILAPHAKLGRDANFDCGGLELIRELITDRGAAPEQLEALREAGVRICLV